MAEPPASSPDDPWKYLLSYLDDQRRLIAAGKVQRWDVFKWAFTVNIALAASLAATHKLDAASGQVRWVFVAMALLVTIASWYLLYYYNRRVEGARRAGSRIQDELDKLDPHAAAIVGRDRYGPNWDCGELAVFGAFIAVSAVPVGVIAAII